MLTFKIPPKGIKEIRKKMLIYGIPFSFISIAIALLITFSIDYDQNDQIKPASDLYDTSNPYDWITWALPIVVVFSVAGFSMFRTVRRVKKTYESYELTISENLIAREQLNTPTISIYLAEVQEIIKRKNKGFIVRGKTNRDMILIPAQIENYEQLETALEQIKPIATKGKTTSWIKTQRSMGLLAIALMICVYTVENKIIVGVAAVLFTAFFIYSFINIQKSKNVDYSTKRSRWVTLIVVLSVLGLTIMKLMDQL
jgi:heme/copper-type cytochrome/quinol oxidase subunit 2